MCALAYLFNLFKPDDKMKKFLLLLLMFVSVNLAQAIVVTPPPVINTNLTEDALVITATGEGTVTLYVQTIDNVTGQTTTETYEGDGVVTVEIPRLEEETFFINYWAVAQANEDAEPGTTEIEYFVEVPAKEHEFPIEDHERGYWIVLRDRFGHDVWHEIYYVNFTTTAKLYYSVYGGYNPETDEEPHVPIYIVIDGIRYGAPTANTEVDLGNALNNPLIEGDNFYLISAGYKFAMGVNQALSGELYLYAIRLGYPLIYDEVSHEWVPEDPTQFITGDADGNAKVTIADVTTIIDYLLSGYSTGMNMGNADVDGSGKVTIEDVTLLIDFLLRGTWW